MEARQLFFNIQVSIICCVLALLFDGLHPWPYTTTFNRREFISPFYFAASHLSLVLIHIVWLIPEWLYVVNILAFGGSLVFHFRFQELRNNILLCMVMAGVALSIMKLLTVHLFVTNESRQVWISVLVSVIILMIVGLKAANLSVILLWHLVGLTIGLVTVGIHMLPLLQISFCNLFWLYVLTLEFSATCGDFIFRVFNRRLDKV